MEYLSDWPFQGTFLETPYGNLIGRELKVPTVQGTIIGLPLSYRGYRRDSILLYRLRSEYRNRLKYPNYISNALQTEHSTEPLYTREIQGYAPLKYVSLATPMRLSFFPRVS